MLRFAGIFLIGAIILTSSFASDSPEPKKKRKELIPDDPFSGYFPDANAPGQSTVSSREAGGEESEGDNDDGESEVENEGGSSQNGKTTRAGDIIPAVEVFVDLPPQFVVAPPEPSTPAVPPAVEVPVVIIGEPVQSFTGQLQYQDAPRISQQYHSRPVHLFQKASLLYPKPSVYPVQSKFETSYINVVANSISKNINNIGYYKDYPSKVDFIPTQVSLLVPSPLSQTKVLPYPDVTPASYIIKNRKSHPGYRIADHNSPQIGQIVPTPPGLNPSRYQKAHAPAANPDYYSATPEVPPPRYQPKYNEILISAEFHVPPTTPIPIVHHKPDHLNQVSVQHQYEKQQERYPQINSYFHQPAPSAYRPPNNPYPVVEAVANPVRYPNEQPGGRSTYPEYALYQKYPKKVESSLYQPLDYLAYPKSSYARGPEGIVNSYQQAPTILQKAHNSNYGSTVHSPVPENPPVPLPTEAPTPVALVPACAEETGLLYCLDDPEYPILEITTYIAQNPDTYQLLRPMIPWTHAHSTGQSGSAVSHQNEHAHPPKSSSSHVPQRDKMCASLIDLSGKVYRALNTEGKWKVVVHLPDSYQISLLETCDTNLTCHHVNPHVPTQCEQEYALQQLMVFSPEFGVHVDQIKIPLGCKCSVVKQPSPSSIPSHPDGQLYSSRIAR